MSPEEDARPRPTWKEAPLYVRCHDLLRYLVEITAGNDPRSWEQVGAPLVANARELLYAVSLALTFVEARSERIREADAAVVRLRVLARVGGEVGVLPPGACRHVGRELLAIGSMVGGWQKRLRNARGRSQDGQVAPAR